MLLMVVTLDVSKLSGWLNADAYCRESNGGHTVRGEVRAGGREVAGDRGTSSAQGQARLLIVGAGHEAAHEKHVAHGCDAGCVEAQRLVERRRGLPRVKRRAYGAWRGVGRGVGGGGRPDSNCREGPSCRVAVGHERSAPKTWTPCS